MVETAAVIPFEEQIKGERFHPGQRIRAYLFSWTLEEEDITSTSRSHPKFLIELFKNENTVLMVQ